MINIWPQRNFFASLLPRLCWDGYGSSLVIQKCESFSSRKYNYFEGKYLLSTEDLTLLRDLTHSMLIIGVSRSSFSFRLNL